MQTIGIVAEWNPFHNGHKHLIDCIRADTPESCIVAVMSGAFCQRGEAGCFDKWIRTEMALAAGVDVVLELPQVYATSSLEGFAHGGVASLLAFTPISRLYCGSESGDEDKLHRQASYLQAHRTAYDAFIQSASAEGISYTEASQHFLETAGIGTGKACPNDRLALHYRLALPDEVPLHLITRTVSHHATNGKGAMMSGSAIRNHLPDCVEEVRRYLPDTSFSCIKTALENGRRLPDSAPLFHSLRILACALDVATLAKRLDIRDGWENRFLAAILQADDFEDLLSRAQTKHYSRSRVQRIILQLLSPLPAPPQTPGYCRVLGFSMRGRALLRARDSHVPCILNTAKDARLLSESARRLLLADIHRQDLADCLYNLKPRHRDYLERPRFTTSL